MTSLDAIRAAAEAASTMPASVFEYDQPLHALDEDVQALLCQDGETDEWKLNLPWQTVLRLLGVVRHASDLAELYRKEPMAHHTGVCPECDLVRAVRALDQP